MSEGIRCPNNHYYDPDKYSSCPHCQRANQQAVQGGDSCTVTLTSPSLSRPAAQAPTPLPNMTETVVGGGGMDFDDDKTIGMFKDRTGVPPVVGWLVCVKGSHYGEDFRLQGGRNFIGRSRDMDVCLSGEMTVSRDKHAVVLYDPKQNAFLAQMGTSKELLYVNDQLITETVRLKAHDVLQVGEVELMLIPCCDEAFCWNQ